MISKKDFRKQKIKSTKYGRLMNLLKFCMKKKNISKKRRCRHAEVISNSCNRKSNPGDIMNAFKSIFS